MDITTFRWILIILGVAIIAGIFLLGNPDKKPRRASRKRQKKARRNRRKAEPKSARQRREPTLDGTQEPGAGHSGEAVSADGAQGELRMEAPVPAAPVPAPDKIVTLYLRARDNHRISGLDLLDSALKSGMVFGSHDIFHRQIEGGDLPLFSMANLEKPGSFDKDNWNMLETRGVTLFMTLPGPLGALDAWDAMLATSRRLAELLHADLLDDARDVFTRQREGEIRKDLREYEREKLPEQ